MSNFNKTENGAISRSVARWNRIARMAGLPGVSRSEWLAILDRYNNKCAYCGKSGRMTIDHVIPVVRGGQHTVKNIVPACAACNSEKHCKMQEEQVTGQARIPLLE